MSVFDAENVFDKTFSESSNISTYTRDVEETKMRNNELGTHEPDHQEKHSAPKR